MNNETKGERALVTLVGEVRGNLVRVRRLRSAGFALQECREGSECADSVHVWLREAEVVKCGAFLVQVWQVDEVPVGLEAVALTLDVIGEGGALSEWMILLLNEVGVVLGENGKLGESSLKDVGVVGLQKGLRLSRDEKMCGTPECLNLRGKSGEGEDRRGVGNHLTCY